jgi:adenylate kinase
MIPFIMKHRGLSAEPIEVSRLLTSPEMQKLKAEGKLVGDLQVMELLFKELLSPQYASGCIVDGFPRTKLQVVLVSFLFFHPIFLSLTVSPSISVVRLNVSNCFLTKC